MAFIRILTAERIEKMTGGENAQLFGQLKADVLAGNVFPAVRNNELHFYYKGGCLYRFVKGVFVRDSNFNRYSEGTEGLPPYERAKKENENKFTNKKGGVTERGLLDRLYSNTYNHSLKSRVVVLDIEVNLNGLVGKGKKCDLVLLNTTTDEIMFVEGKVFSDSRVKCLYGTVPEVIEQVNVYTQAITEQKETVIEQYAEHIRIVNSLFSTSYKPPKKIIIPAKLLVYGTDYLNLTANGEYSIHTITDKLGKGNVMWVEKGAEPTLEEIWNALCGEICR